jgi:hypothetical protein
MNGKKSWLGSLAVVLLGLGVVRGQGVNPPVGAPYAPTPMPYGSGAPGAPTGPTTDPGGPPPNFTLSKWITGEHSPGCCGPLGGGPIGSEIYLRSGVSFPVGGGLSSSVKPGWDIEGGGRVLFFNREVDAAWTVDCGLSYIFNPASDKNGPFTLFNVPVQTVNAVGQATTLMVPNIDVTVGNLNRTYVNLAGGREVWLLGTADSSHHDLNVRVGWDVGGGWGTEKMELNELKHRNDIISRLFLSIHTDAEVPCGSCILQAGLRLEYGYTWGDALQSHNNGDNQDINLTATIGVRF